MPRHPTRNCEWRSPSAPSIWDSICARPECQVNDARFSDSAADAYMWAGSFSAVSQIFRRNFPSQSLGLSYNGNLRTMCAQADYGVEQLQLQANRVQCAQGPEPSGRRHLESNDFPAAGGLPVPGGDAGPDARSAVSRRRRKKIQARQPRRYLMSSRPNATCATAKSNVIAAAAHTPMRKSASTRSGTTLQVYNISLDEALRDAWHGDPLRKPLHPANDR